MLATATDIEIRVFDAQTATDAEWIAMTEFRNLLLAERLPDDPPRTVAQRQAQFRELPPVFGQFLWLALDGQSGQIAGFAQMIITNTEENRHLAMFGLEVLPALRRQGVGRRLLAAVAAQAAAEGRRMLATEGYGAVPAGAAFLTRIGATVALEAHINQLDLADLDRALLDRWQSAAPEHAAGFTLGWWIGAYPEAELADIVTLYEAANLVPHGDLDVEDFHWTAAHLRQQEAYYLARGDERWTAYVRAQESGELAGFTEVNWNPANPTQLRQEMTAVWPKYRGRGLGRWLKAAMLDRVLRERPQVRFVRTGNADSNAPMLKINHELGFRAYQSDSLWQVPLVQVQAYLAGHAEGER